MSGAPMQVEVPEPLRRRTAVALLVALDALDAVRGVCWQYRRLEATGEVMADHASLMDTDKSNESLREASGVEALHDILCAIDQASRR